jgi:hypothetical protein
MAKQTKSKKRAPTKTSGSTGRSSADKATGVSQTLSWIGETVNTPLVREAIAAALIAGAGAAAAVFAGQNSGAQKRARSLGTMISDATRDMTNSAAGALAGAATDAVNELMPNGGVRNDDGRSSRRRGSKA